MTLSRSANNTLCKKANVIHARADSEMPDAAPPLLEPFQRASQRIGAAPERLAKFHNIANGSFDALRVRDFFASERVTDFQTGRGQLVDVRF
jgi:hypothetical protein